MAGEHASSESTRAHAISRAAVTSFPGLEIHAITRATARSSITPSEPPTEVGGRDPRTPTTPAPIERPPHRLPATALKEKSETRELCVEISPLDPPATTADVEREWAKIVAANPRVYNGPHLSVVSIDFDEARIHCRRDTFQRLIVQPRVRTGMRLLAVSALVVARDARGREHVLLGRRGASVRIYPGMWEFGPAGGVTPPHVSVRALSEHDLKRNLAEEMEEEIGVTFPVGEPIAIVRDTIAFSDDIIFRCDAGDLGVARRAMGEPSNWEYSETKWIAVDELGAFASTQAEQIILPTRAMIKLLGWS